MPDPETLEGIAIVGMSGRFPGARDLEEYWRNLRGGVEAISRFTAEELEAAGVPREILEAPDYVRAGGVIEGVELFDAQLFGFTAREAELLDPHHRLFLETAWQALEHAGYDSSRYPGAIGVFGGMGMGEYLLKNLHSNPEVLRAAGGLRLRIYNDKDFLASLTAYKLDLKGPSVSVQTACSTSLVAASLACQSLMSYQCDMALAGGVCLSVPPKSGYFAHEGVFSPDGHCRAFDAGAQGTVAGAGAGVLVLKRLADAVAEGDTVHAVIKGWAMNNDGSLKVGYTAPSLDGQAEVIAMAQAVAGVDPASVTYVEAHGTGTPLGDQIEIAALTQVFRESTDRTGFCAVGSVKTAIGHLDAAAGAASLIKTALALKHREIPPSLNFERPNPAIDFAGGPFYVNAALRLWETDGGPRRAGVSAFAVGGVNAHLVLEEAPAPAPADPGRPWQLLVLSARTETALEAATDQLAAYLERPDRPDLADVAFTLERGRRVLRHRRALVCRDADEAAAILRGRDPRRLLTAAREAGGRQAAFLFPGLGNHYVGMARGLYRDEEVFRREIDRCAEILEPHLGVDLRTVLYPAEMEEPEAAGGGAPDLRRMLRRGGAGEGAGELIQTRLAQPVLFAVEYALAQLWREWGVEPRAMAGYSMGEYVAACLAGVFTLEDALRLVAERARLIDALPAGAMLAVPLSEEAVRSLLGGDISLAAVNGPEVCVVAGPVPAIQELERRLAASGVACRRLETTHAFHSTMMEPIAGRFAEMVRAVPRQAPRIPWLSNVTGTWITPQQATDPRYWAEHLVQPVRFADILRELWREPSRVLLEVGPGQALSAWALQLPAEAGEAGERVALPTLRHLYDPQPDGAFLLATLGRLWLAGMDVPGAGFRAGERRRRVPLPTYPFERSRYWIDPGRTRPLAPQAEESLERAAIPDWFWTPAWKESPALAAAPQEEASGPWLVFADREGLGFRLAGLLEERGAEVVLAVAGERFERVEEGAYVLASADREGYVRLLADLAAEGRSPARVLHLWGVTREAPPAGEALDLGLHSLVFLGQALADSRREEPLELTVVASHLHAVTGDEEVHPEKATLLGACAVLPLEVPGVSCRVIDLLPPAPGSRRERELPERLLAELADPVERIVAWRGGRRWTRDFQASRLTETSARGLRRGGVYLITGGRGGIGLVLARELARSVRAKLVLVGRSPVPPELPRELEALGAEVLAVTADVTDRDVMRRVRALAEERFGAIHGVLHAAGVPPGGMLQLKTKEQLAEVLAPKVAGTRVLEEVFADADLDFLMLFSSLTSLLGAFGLVDHAAANAFLDAFAHDAARRGIPAVSVHWDAWLEVGQAAAAAAGYGLDEAGGTVHTDVLRTDTHWVVDEHRIAGQGLLPGTAYLEMVSAAFARQEGKAPAELSRVTFTGPLIVPDGEAVEVRTVLAPAGDGHDFRVESRTGSGPWREHARGRVRAADSAGGGKADLARLAAEAQGREAGPAAGERERGIGFGPRWQGLVRSLTASGNQALALLELPEEFHSDLREHPLHPALLDAATGFVQLLGEGTYLPLGYEKVTVRRPLPARFYSHARYDGGAAGETLACDLTLLGEDGEELVAIEGYTLRRIGDPQAVAVAVPSVQRETLEGIRPEEGVEAFRRLLSAGPLPPEILVSIRPFPALLRRSRTLSRERLMEEAERLHPTGAVHARPNLPTPFVAPRNEAEERLAGLWRNLLGLEAVGVHDDFFDLGGDSLLATRLIGLLEEAFGVQLSLRAVFEAPTVGEMAALIATDAAPARPAVPLREPGAGRFPLSPGQQRFWFLDRLQPCSGAYNIPVAARLRGDLDPGALARGFAALGERHEALRTFFAEEDGQPVQAIAPAFPAALPLADLGGLPPCARDAEVRRLAVAEAHAPFDLARGPLVRLRLLRLSADEHVALLTFHHAVADRWSVGIFFRELMALYEALRASQPSPLPPLAFQYADYAVWQRGRLEEGGLLEKQIGYWRERLAGAPAALDLPTDFPRPRAPHSSVRLGQLPLAVDRALTESLRALGRGSEASLSMVLLAAFNALLARFSRQEDVLVGSPIANRGLAGAQELIGHFANDLVLRTGLAGDPSFRELLARVREGALGAYDNADVPIEKLIEVLRPEREPGRAPFAQVFFVLENVPMPSAGPRGLAVELLEVERPAGQFDLLAFLSETPEGVSGSLFYDADLFAADTMRRFAESFGAILERVARDPGARLSALPLAGELEARAEKLLVAVTATFTADLLADPLAAWMEELGIRSRIELAPYNQVFQQLLDPSSLLGRNDRGVNAVLVRFEDWERDSERNVRDLAAALRASAARSAAFHLVVSCPPSPGREELHAALEGRMAEALAGSGVHLVRADEILDLYPVAAPWDPHANAIGHVPYTTEFFAVLGTAIARKIHARRAAPVKAIAVDCDNTLWCGVCGEDGPLGVAVDPPQRALQEFLVAQHDAGVLICLLSKNSEADVDEVFARRSEMPLRPGHVVARRIDWEPKSANLRSLAAELGLGLDAFAVLDDNPVERAEIQAGCPEALVLLLPERPEEIPGFLRHVWAFDRLEVTAEDRQRTALYRQNLERERFRGEAASFADFLAGLRLEVGIAEIESRHIERAAQLTVRTNQFNASTVRRTEAEVRDFLAGGGEGRIVTVRDRFGDYGLVGLLLFRAAGAALEVDTFLLSCRVLGKGVEHRMLAELGRLAGGRGLAEVVVPFRRTPRNQPVLDFLSAAGTAEGSVYRFAAADAAAVSLTTPAPAASGEPEAAAPVRAAGRRTGAELSDPGELLAWVRSRRRPAAVEPEKAYVAPRTPVEEMLAEIWADLLGVDRVGVHDSFFRLGGHSLLGTVLLSRVRDAFDVEVPLFALFESPTLGGLAARIEEALIRDAGADEIGLAELAGMSDEEVRTLLEAEAEGVL